MQLTHEIEKTEEALLIKSINNSLKQLKEKAEKINFYVNKYFPAENTQQETQQTTIRRIV